MKIITPSFEILGNPDSSAILQNIETFGRVCYKSEEKIAPESANVIKIRRFKGWMRCIHPLIHFC